MNIVCSLNRSNAASYASVTAAHCYFIIVLSKDGVSRFYLGVVSEGQSKGELDRATRLLSAVGIGAAGRHLHIFASGNLIALAVPASLVS